MQIEDYIMMNKRRTSLMAAVLVGTTMLFNPVQAGIPKDCMEWDR